MTTKRHGPPGGMTFEEIALELGVTPERVRQIEKKALLKLRRRLPNASELRAQLMDREYEVPWFPRRYG